MLARHDGRIVLVEGAIPGERVRARVERRAKDVVFASTTEVIEASPDRREPAHDPACGGAAFAHVAYTRQLELKQQILTDAFRRQARIMLEPAPSVAASPEHGYRLRARLHVSHGRAGYFREGTHTICDAAATGQLSVDAARLTQGVVDAMGAEAAACAAVVVSENVEISERVLHLEPAQGARIANLSRDAASSAGVTGVTTIIDGRLVTIAGADAVTDSAGALFGGDAPIDTDVTWTRRAPAFFQANRYLVGRLLRRVLESTAGERVVDLYAGVGLFSVALAAAGTRVIAVEGEPFAVADLRTNARPWPDRLEVAAGSVEDVVAHAPPFVPTAVIVDPPRTGLSPAAAQGLAAWAVPQLVYVSCDPPTLARDAGRLVQAGYRLQSVEAFDLFPNTPHVEALAVFARV